MKRRSTGRRLVFQYCKDQPGANHHEMGHHERCPDCAGSGFQLLSRPGEKEMGFSEVLAWRAAVINAFVGAPLSSPEEDFFALWFGALEDELERIHTYRYGWRGKD